MAGTIFLLTFSLAIFATSGVESIGVCYGRLGNNLPSPQAVVSLYRTNNINRMRVYDPNQDVLNALRGSNIEVILGVPNEELQGLTDPNYAVSWVQNNVVRFWPSVRFRYIAVGNEVSPIYNPSQAGLVRPALVNVFNAIRSAGLNDQIKVSTAIDMTLIGVSYPPSNGAFRDDVRWFVDPIIGHLVWARTPILVNIYPYFSYRDNPRVISLPYALFTSPNVVVWDNGLGYQNLFDAMLDSVYSALGRAWGGDLDVVVSESGWPSAGGLGASFDNARVYLSNLIGHVNGGTPKRPNRAIEAYIFAMFDENQKPGPDIERNFGLFRPDSSSKYNIRFGSERGLWDVVNNSSTLEQFASDM